MALTGHLLHDTGEVHALLVGHGGGELHALLVGVVGEPVEERLAVVVVAIDEDDLLVAHGLGGGEHDLALGDVALGEEPRVGLAGVDALQLGTGTRGHDDGQPLLPGVLQERHGVAGVVGADDGVAGIVALLGVRQIVGQHVQVFGVLIVVAQVQFHLSLQLGLCLFDVVHCHVDGQLPFVLYAGWQHHINVKDVYLGFLHRHRRCLVVVAAAGHKADRQDGHQCISYYLLHIHIYCFEVIASLTSLTSYILLLTSHFLHLTSYILLLTSHFSLTTSPKL